MKHLYLPFRCDHKKEITLTGPDFHYLTHVLRFKKGTSFKVLDVTGRRYSVQVKRILKDSLLLSVETDEQYSTFVESQLYSKKRWLSPGLPPLILFQALPKGKVMDRIIRQATETGVSRIIPIITQYTIVHPKSVKSVDNRLQRWGRIVKGAVQQSEGALFPHISPPVDIRDAIKSCRGVKLFFHQDKKENMALHECLEHHCGDINIFIGPEGGFSDSEYNLLKKNGFIPINVGNTVLRVDTAAVFALAAVKIVLLEKEKWRRV